MNENAMTPLCLDDANAYIGNNIKPTWAIINFPEELPGKSECWKLFLSSEEDSNWHQVSFELSDSLKPLFKRAPFLSRIG